MPKIAISAILILAVIFAILFGAWDHLDRGGWISHRQADGHVHRPVCVEEPKSDQERVDRRGLSDEEKHIGKIEWLWWCRRNESSVTCWAVN